MKIVLSSDQFRLQLSRHDQLTPARLLRIGVAGCHRRCLLSKSILHLFDEGGLFVHPILLIQSSTVAVARLESNAEKPSTEKNECGQLHRLRLRSDLLESNDG